jgi:ABC-type phosphate transport system substrate-binding protein
MTIRSLRLALVAGLGLLVLAPQASAQVAVVAGAGKALSAEQVAEVFAGVVTTWPDGTKVQIVEHADPAIAREFYQKVVKKPQPIAKAQITRNALSGQGLAPKRGASDAEVAELVRKTPGAIGFVSGAAPTDGLAVLLKVP